MRVIRDQQLRALPRAILIDSYDEPLYFETIDEAAKYVSDIVGHPIEPSVEAIDQALDGYLAEHEDNDAWYSFHEFIEDREG
jgi:hypothetical protein